MKTLKGYVFAQDHISKWKENQDLGLDIPAATSVFIPAQVHHLSLSPCCTQRAGSSAVTWEQNSSPSDAAETTRRAFNLPVICWESVSSGARAGL